MQVCAVSYSFQEKKVLCASILALFIYPKRISLHVYFSAVAETNVSVVYSMTHSSKQNYQTEYVLK